MTNDSVIQILERPPVAEIAARPEDFLRDLGRPSWIRIPGLDRTRQRIAVTLLHGNEPSGFRAMHAWLRSDHEAAVDTVFFIASVETALADGGFRHRSLPGERDANRCFGPFVDDGPGRIAAAFTALFQAERFEALVDIHNNTGHNPAYGIGYGLDSARLNLSSLFADWYMHTDLPLNTLMEMSQLKCPSVAVECGRAGDPAADAVALAGLDRFLHLEALGLDSRPPGHIRVLAHPHRIHLRPNVDVAFGAQPQLGAQLTLRADIDRHNFAELPVGSTLGWVSEGLDLPLTACGVEGQDLGAQMFGLQDGELITRAPMVPVMMTTDLTIARSDCLFYAMTPQALPI